MSAGKVAGGTGIVFAVTPAIVFSTVLPPVVGSNRRYSWVVTTRALLSIPKAVPRGGFARTNVCLVLFAERSMSVMALVAEAGGALLPKWVVSSQRPLGDSEMELGCAATLMDVRIVLLSVDMTSIRLAVKLAMYSKWRVSSSAKSLASP